MTTTTATDENVSTHDPRPSYIDVGTDQRGRVHTYDTATETVHVVSPRRGRVKRVDITADAEISSIEGYIAKYGGSRNRDWRELRYGAGVLIERLMEVV